MIIATELDPGIAHVVTALMEQGFTPTDSGDGSKAGTMEGALDYPHVFMTVNPAQIIEESYRLHRLWPGWTVEASFRPSDGIGVLMLCKETP